MQSYEEYIDHVTDDISECLESMGCQPILFIGSGLSKRYFNGPSWEELLIKLSDRCPKIDKEFAYYKQSYHSYDEIGDIFAEFYKEWAWGEGKVEFDPDLFDASKPADIYIKYKVREILEKITPTSLDEVQNDDLKGEIDLLQRIHPHSVVTTNYDTFLESIFPDYSPIIGQRILRSDHMSIGEIFKIHGCITQADSIVLTKRDYEEFKNKKKYLSAKLLTYFLEHPLLFIGYSAEDQNIKAILSDIDEILSPDNELIPNIYILEWNENISESDYPAREKLISIDKHKSVRIKSISASSFEWVFKAFRSNEVIEKVNPKLLRALLARTYKLVRHDIPRKSLEVDFKTLEKAVDEEDGLPSIYGITTFDNASDINLTYPYTLTQVGKKLGYDNWHPANRLIEKIRDEKGINIKQSDNKYHVTIKIGDKMHSRKYSEAAVDLLKQVDNDEDYDIRLDD